MKPFFEIPYYHDYLSPELARTLLSRARAIPGTEGLVEVGPGGGLETPEALRFLTELYLEVKDELARVLAQRIVDRKFLDERTRACAEFNRRLHRPISDPEYQTTLGLEDAQGRIVFGPKQKDYARAGGAPVAPLPEYLTGPHVTLFGPPDSAKLALNAMNAYHRKLPNEPAIVGQLLDGQAASPMWGADDEDSKTPLRADLIDAGVNLSACFDQTIELTEGSKHYALAADHLALPIKRFPGLALPCSFLFLGENPIPLHLYDFALHLFRNWRQPRALVFYVPKLENEEEARYIHAMVSAAERLTQARHPEYRAGTVRLMIVLENPRAIVRAHEIMDALYPYFAGASLGWHDYLASTARLFKEDPHYRIPVKADPNIVIKYIQASHHLVANAVGSRGGIRVGGMYGILPIAGEPRSLQITLRGFFKDVITQMKRDLTGFWVAHPDFVRLGLAIVEAWRLRQSGDPSPLRTLVTSLMEPEFQADLLAFVDGPDIVGLDPSDPNYARSLIVADIEESDFIPNHHPDEIRYNVFQSLQYLTDWLSGNGCVALPTIIDGVPVRVMDDLATAERSRWEVWAELRHGRFSLEEFVRIAHEEMNFIRRDLSNDRKIVQVKWDERTARWYPIAFRLMLQLMTDAKPAEFATELLIPFTVEDIRQAADPWAKARELDPLKFRLEPYVEAYDHYFEICGVERFAREMARGLYEDRRLAEEIALSFTTDEILSAASFHGDIGQSKRTLDARAAREQAGVSDEEEAVLAELRLLGEKYRAKYGFKFLISAQGKSATDMRTALLRRLGDATQPPTETEAEAERQSARQALWEISRKRMLASPRGRLSDGLDRFEALRRKHAITGAALAINLHGHTQTASFGESAPGQGSVEPDTWFEIASLSKTIASAFALEYFRERGIPLTTSVNALFAGAGSSFRLDSAEHPGWGNQVDLSHLMNHTALGMHYVKGFSPHQPMPATLELLEGHHGYEKIRILDEPGKSFHYSGGGFLVLEHLIETLEKRPIRELTRRFLDRMGLADLSFSTADIGIAHGVLDDGTTVPGGRLDFPAFAAGGFGSARDVAGFLDHLTRAYASPSGAGPLSHDTAVQMLQGFDRGCMDFMGCRMGLGVFVAEAGENRLAIHQGANEGFRALYIQCFAGPDRGKGLVLLCNGDNRAVQFIALVAQSVLTDLGMSGIDYARFQSAFDFKGLQQEQIVNLGYKALLFSAFRPDLPNRIVVQGPHDPLAPYNLATRARIVAVTNQRFARAENLLSPRLPVFDPELFERQGKTMDSWETVRHNPFPYDTLELELERPAQIRWVSLSTKFHDGNHPEAVRILGQDTYGNWLEILPETRLEGHSMLLLDLGEAAAMSAVSHLWVDQFPDGGLSRLGLYADLPSEVIPLFKRDARCVRFKDEIPKSKKPLSIPYSARPGEVARNCARVPKAEIDHASLAFGGSVLRASNEHYGPAAQVVSPFPALHMFDGLESARSRKPGHFEEVTLRLGRPVRIARVELDFTHFVNNNPMFMSVEALQGETWVELTGKTPVKAFAGNTKHLSITHPGIFQDLRIRAFPDGGVNRIRVFERLAEA